MFLTALRKTFPSLLTMTSTGPVPSPAKKPNVFSSPSSAAIEPFAVCEDVEVGPLLAPLDPSSIRDTWGRIEKNKDSSDPAKTKGDPRFIGRRRFGTPPRDNPQSEPEKFGTVEAMSDLREASDRRWPSCANLVHDDFNSVNLLVEAVHTAFYKHYPLRLGPDVIWVTIVQGVAKHVDKNPELHRSKFVDFDGKKKVVVVRPEFVKGSPDNDWATVFPQFAEHIASYIGAEKAANLSCDFTTSTPTDQVCAHIALMDTVKHYFEYEMLCGCGIPSIELTGTTADWIRLRQKAEAVLGVFKDLEWWTPELLAVLDQFVRAASGDPDVKFWNSVCNLHGGSGFWMDFVTGWIQVLFPYTNGGERSWDIAGWRKCYEIGTGEEIKDYNRGVRPASWSDTRWGGFGSGMKLDLIPVGMSQAPILYKDVSQNKSFDMTFNGGVVAILQDKETRAIEPVTGWAVLDHGEI